MTKHGSFKKVVRRHAHDTGQRYTEALTDLEGLQARMFHQPAGERPISSAARFERSRPRP